MKITRSSIFIKLIITFLIVLIPLYLLTLIINSKGISSITNEISQSSMRTNYFYMNSLEKEIGKISQLLQEYVVDKDLTQLSIGGDQISDYERIESVLALQRRLQLLKSSSIYIQEAKAYIPLIDRTISTADYDTSISQPEFQALQTLNPGPLIHWNDRVFLSLQYPSYGLSNRSPIFILGVELSQFALRNMLQNITGADAGEALLINDRNHWSIPSEQVTSLLGVLSNLVQRELAQGRTSGFKPVTFDANKYLVSFQHSTLLDTSLLVYVPEKQILSPLHKYRIWFWLMSLASIFIILFFSYSIYRLVHTPLLRLVNAFNKVETGSLEASEISQQYRKDEFGYLYQKFNKMIAHLRQLIDEVYEEKIRSQRFELKQLQAQINPHFFYNCFFILQRMLRQPGNETAQKFALYLGEYFRFITRNAVDEIALDIEIKHAQTYVDIQKICFGSFIEVQFEPFEPSPPSICVPRLIVQPIIENAYRHAFRNNTSSGKIWIHSEENYPYFSISVEDNGEETDQHQIHILMAKLIPSEEKIEETTGVFNVHRRIQLKFGDDCGLFFSQSRLGGLKAEIRLKLNN